MTELRPWVGFESLVEGLARLQARARKAAARSVDEILTLRNWLIGAWIVAYEQEGADRVRYGEGLMMPWLRCSRSVVSTGLAVAI
jgi:hypothetical protein